MSYIPCFDCQQLVSYQVAFRPYRRSTLTKKEGLDMRDEWNALIDRYIAEAPKRGDRRPHDTITRYNKINEAGGPFWRICANCHKDEGIDQVQYKACGKCKSVSTVSLHTDGGLNTEWSRFRCSTARLSVKKPIGNNTRSSVRQSSTRCIHTAIKGASSPRRGSLFVR